MENYKIQILIFIKRISKNLIVYGTFKTDVFLMKVFNMTSMKNEPSFIQEIIGNRNDIILNDCRVTILVLLEGLIS